MNQEISKRQRRISEMYEVRDHASQLFSQPQTVPQPELDNILSAIYSPVLEDSSTKSGRKRQKNELETFKSRLQKDLQDNPAALASVFVDKKFVQPLEDTAYLSLVMFRRTQAIVPLKSFGLFFASSIGASLIASCVRDGQAELADSDPATVTGVSLASENLDVSVSDQTDMYLMMERVHQKYAAILKDFPDGKSLIDAVVEWIKGNNRFDFPFDPTEGSIKPYAVAGAQQAQRLYLATYSLAEEIAR